MSPIHIDHEFRASLFFRVGGCDERMLCLEGQEGGDHLGPQFRAGRFAQALGRALAGLEDKAVSLI